VSTGLVVALALMVAPLGLVAFATGDGPLDSEDPTLRQRPFTADQIRSAWKPGLEIVWHHVQGDETWSDRWRVLDANEETATLEAVRLDESGAPSGQPMTTTSRFDELRDHAAFPADRCTREDAEMETALGTLTGWLYVVDKPDESLVSRYFFSPAYPGPPLVVTVEKESEIIYRFEQVSRRM
jgi:hypothetical protein